MLHTVLRRHLSTLASILFMIFFPKCGHIMVAPYNLCLGSLYYFVSILSVPIPDPLHLCSDEIRSVAQSCPTLCDPMNRITPGLPVHHQLPEFTETHLLAAPQNLLPTPAPNPLSVPLLDFHTKGVTQSMTFRVGLPSLSTRFSRVMHVASRVRSLSLLSAESSSIVCM